MYLYSREEQVVSVGIDQIVKQITVPILMTQKEQLLLYFLNLHNV